MRCHVVDDSGRQRRFWTDNHEIDVELGRHVGNRGSVGRFDTLDQGSQLGETGIARQGVHDSGGL